MTAIGSNEIKWTKSFATPQMNYCRPVDVPELPDEYISLIQRYLTILPHFMDRVPRDLYSKKLWHCDLHLDNIFVDPDTRAITCVIDWQSTAVTEVLFQTKLPPLLPPVGGYPQTAKEESDSSKAVSPSNEIDAILGHYQNLTKIKNPLRWAAINSDSLGILTKPTSLLTGSWSRNDVFSFRHALISIAAHWEDISPNTPCPIDFTEKELELHNEEMELLEELSTVLHLLEDKNLISVGGRVLRENFERAQAVNQHVKKMLIDMGEDEKTKTLYERIWPY